jgi:hypothetical protein
MIILSCRSHLSILKILASIFVLLLTASFTLNSRTKAKFKNASENETCFKCHGQSKYSYENPELNKTVYKRMGSNRIINRDLFYDSNHKQFKCVDCHAEEYATFPHAGELRMAEKYACIDCHGDDPKYAKFEFEKIETEFKESVHSTKHNEDFTCWMCHDAHTYKTNARNNENIKKTVAYDNSICLSCHADITKYQLLTDKANPNILVKHEWLPNQALHFKNVRCIECHAQVNDTLMVAHNVRPKAEAVKNCVECHTKNSILMTSLYKFKVKEERSKAGFFNGVILNESYVIGANRNYYLNVLSLIIFGMVMAGILLHASLRIIKRNKTKNVR